MGRPSTDCIFTSIINTTVSMFQVQRLLYGKRQPEDMFATILLARSKVSKSITVPNKETKY